MTSSSEKIKETAVEMVAPAPEEQEVPLLGASDRPKINIFSLSSYPKLPLHKEQVTSSVETNASTFFQFIIWAWSASRYSGLLCMGLSSTIYWIMELVSDLFSAQSIPLLETASVRCGIILVLSFIWLRRNGQTMFGPSHARKFLVCRTVTGFISLLGFVYCIQILPMSQAIVLSFTTPIFASLAARVVLNEKVKFAEMLGLASSFFGVLFIFQPMFVTQGWLAKGAETVNSQLSHHYFAVLAGLISSIIGGISYCLIRAGAKASDQPVSTVFSFGLLAGPASLICSFLFEVFHTVNTLMYESRLIEYQSDEDYPNGLRASWFLFFLMILLGIMAFFAEVLLARGLELEKTSKVANILYIEAALSQLWGLSSLQVSPSFGRLAGCLLIFISAGYTMYIGPDKDS